MDARLGLLAEYASVSTDAKLNVLGIFDQLSVSTFPAGLPIFYVVVSLTAGPAEFGTEKRIAIVLNGEDGAELLRSEQTAIVPRPTRAGIRSTLNVVNGFAALGFPRAGTYQFSAVVDGRTEITIPLYVVQVEGAPQ